MMKRSENLEEKIEKEGERGGGEGWEELRRRVTKLEGEGKIIGGKIKWREGWRKE